MARNFLHTPQSGGGEHVSAAIEFMDDDWELERAWVEVDKPTVWVMKGVLLDYEPRFITYRAWDGRIWNATIMEDGMTFMHTPKDGGPSHPDKYIGYKNHHRNWQASFVSNP